MAGLDLSFLLAPHRLPGGLGLKNRIVQAPCTRNRATSNLSPTPGAVGYYAARAQAGLLITEAVLIEHAAQGYLSTPGLFLDSHVPAWAAVTDAVHAADGLIFAQLWHTGRMAHSHWSGVQPVAPSAVLDPILRRQAGVVNLYNELPRAMTQADIARTLDNFGSAAARALRAGFDGVEIHAANGYLPEQFLRAHTNRRTDAWGGPAANRCRFTLEVVDRCHAVFGSGRVGVRLSPAAYFSEMQWSAGDNEVYVHLLEELARRPIAYVHTGVVVDEPVQYLHGTSSQFLRRHWGGTLIGNGGYTVETAERQLEAKAFDLIAFGKLFIANADLVQRIRDGTELVPYARAFLDELT